MLYDITLPIQDGLAAWPGDVPYSYELGWKIGHNESPVNVGVVNMSTHTGTHADAPFHFSDDGAGIGETDLFPYIGRAVVIDTQNHDVIPWELFADVDFSQSPRVLLKTGGWPDPMRFPDEIPVLAPDVPARLAERGVVLFGVDVPSVDRVHSKTLPTHHALFYAGIAILESLDLREVPPGTYHLTALPLKLMKADGAPVRAILAPV